LVRLDQATGECVAASAGHPPAVRFGRGDTAELEWVKAGPPLGARVIREGDVAFRLAPGESLVMYTDGLVERRGELLDERLKRLQKFLSTVDPATPDLAADVVEELCTESDLRDDVAVLALHFGAVRPQLRISRPAQPSEIAPLRSLLRRWFRAANADAEWTE